RIQYFFDTGGEGEVLLGETEVLDGSFEFANPPLLPASLLPSLVTATVTDSLTSDTSQFSVPVTVLPPSLQLQLSRAGDPVSIQAPAGAQKVLLPFDVQV